jgi:hypothetical protein
MQPSRGSQAFFKWKICCRDRLIVNVRHFDMSNLTQIENHFEKLITYGAEIKATAKTPSGSSGNVISIPVTYVDDERSRVWSMNVLSLVRSTFGTDHDYYTEIHRSLKNCNMFDQFMVILSCAKSALDTLKNGYLFETKTLVEADVAADYLDQANQLLDAGYKDAAAVIGGSILERHLREMCITLGVATTKPNGKPMAMNDLNDSLSKQNAYNLLKKKQITAMADIRNNAAHGDYAKYDKEDVNNLLRDVTSFCADYA